MIQDLTPIFPADNLFPVSPRFRKMSYNLHERHDLKKEST